MKKFLFLSLIFASFQMEAVYFQSSVSVTPTDRENVQEYLVEVQIEKVFEKSLSQLVATPKIICAQGETAQLTVESEDKENFLSVHAVIPKDSQNYIYISVLMKEMGKEVLSFDKVVSLS